ncbi:MAG: choice-of-anchor L domain-containing protein [Candidatus Rokuibacteriota bacterium]
MRPRGALAAGLAGAFALALWLGPMAEAQAAPPRKPTSAASLAARLKDTAILPATANDLAAAMDIPGANLVSASIGTSDPGAVGVGTTLLGRAFPRRGGSFAILTTGAAALADQPNSSGSDGTSIPGLDNSQGEDMVQLTLVLSPPPGSQCAVFDFSFFSEEFPEFVGSQFNDAFLAELGASTFVINPDDTITAPNNFAFDPVGNIISINSAFGVSPFTQSTYDGATTLLRAVANISGIVGDVTIVLTITDLGDSIYDSAVFLDNFRFLSSAADCTTGSGLGSSSVSPQSGHLVPNQAFDLVVLTDGAAIGGAVQVNGIDVTQSLLACIFGTRQDRPGNTVRCPGFHAQLAASGPPPWVVVVTINYADGNTQTEVVTYDLLTFETPSEAGLIGLVLPTSSLIATTQNFDLIIALGPTFFSEDVVGGGVTLNGADITAPIVACLNGNPSIPLGSFGSALAFRCSVPAGVLPLGVQVLQVTLQFSSAPVATFGTVLGVVPTVE